MYRTFLSFFLATLIAFGSVAVPTSRAQSKADFSGTWKLNLDKSEFGQVPSPQSEVQVIEHKDQALKMSVDRKGGVNGERKYSYELTTDGKEVSQDFGGSPAKRSAHLEADALVIKTATKYEGNDITIVSRYTLDKEAKILTVASHVTGDFGEIDIKEVFDKQ